MPKVEMREFHKNEKVVGYSAPTEMLEGIPITWQDILDFYSRNAHIDVTISVPDEVTIDDDARREP